MPTDAVFQNIRIHILRSQRKTISLQIQEDGSLLVKAPYFVNDQDIQSFLQEKQSWIEERHSRIQSSQFLQKREYKDGEQLLYLGNVVRLTIGSYPSIRIQDNALLFPDCLTFRIKKELHQWFFYEAKRVITELVNINASRMNVSYVNIVFSDTRSKWGSCMHDNRLQFCWRLIMAPLVVINYVVIHELVHIQEKNHSDRFWTKVRLYAPSYKRHSNWLKTYGHTLVL